MIGDPRSVVGDQYILQAPVGKIPVGLGTVKPQRHKGHKEQK
jgi:hypothetical protein